LLAIALTLLVLAAHPSGLPAALPLLVLWGGSKQVSKWLNASPVEARSQTPAKDIRFLRRTALYTWRYFAEFSTAEHNWLIPDNVQETPPAVAARVSPTNLGLLFNARQVACEFGFLTLPEFAEQTLRTLDTVSRMRKLHGHLINWYDTRTLEALPPLFVSSVDSGNLLASLWTLQQGCLERLARPILQSCLADGLLDHLRILGEARLLSKKRIANFESQTHTDRWLQTILEVPEAELEQASAILSRKKHPASAKWFVEEVRARQRAVARTAYDYAPWRQTEFASLYQDTAINLKLLDSVALKQLPEFIDRLVGQLEILVAAKDTPTYRRLLDLLPQARANITQLIVNLGSIARQAGSLADQMDFSFLLEPRRKLMSVGFNVEADQLNPACYDLLATESRTAIFVAIAKEDIEQEVWFLLGRAHTLDAGRPVLLSWTGTMFEYLMPALWMRSYPNTLLERSRVAAVRSQQAYAARRGVPWGISESAYFKLDESQNYQYHAFGLPQLALHKTETDCLIISPYSTVLALDTDPAGAVRNLRTMFQMGWFGGYGFYEAADYSSLHHRVWQQPYDLVRCWMVHHEGMSLLAIANFLLNDIVQQWFHNERRVQATELLLHEKPVLHVRASDVAGRHAAA
jgi:cyclic beta-1,2-glucan synthetase